MMRAQPVDNIDLTYGSNRQWWCWRSAGVHEDFLHLPSEMPSIFQPLSGVTVTGVVGGVTSQSPAVMVMSASPRR